VVEDLISFGIEDHTLGPIKVREHFPEEESPLLVDSSSFAPTAMQ